MTYTQKTRRGFTLVEVVLYIAIMVTVLLSITTFLIATIDARIKQTTQSQVNQEIITAIQMIIRTAEQQNGIQTPAPGETSSQFILSSADEGVSTITFWQNGTVLMMQKGEQDPIPLTSSGVEVQSFTATNGAADTAHSVIRLEIRARFPNASNRTILNYERTFYGSIFLK